MIWEEENQDLEFKAFIQEMIQMRLGYPELNDASIDWIEVADDSCVAYQRGRLTFVLNNSEQEKSVEVNGQQLTLAPYGYQILGK
ncbi:neopullulanase [Vibrio ishigakensis]|uniref:Neopullulanase n=2 Tax=Vibrio ishigakensis TaxID=1481914 RepID=A0A0B8NZW1_9VIBR|nr:neopullulanase [Vibrio ishigakensis]